MVALYNFMCNLASIGIIFLSLDKTAILLLAFLRIELICEVKFSSLSISNPEFQFV